MERRKTDDPSAGEPRSRSSDRVVIEDGEWFLRTREGLRGPFSSRVQAEQETAAYVETMEFLERNREVLPGDVNQNDIEIVNLIKPRWG